MPTPKTPPPPEPDEPVWTYRGYRLKTSEFVTAMVHFFRAEVQRANLWRQRLDTTTNWAVVSTGATLSVAFSQPDIHHGIIILNTLLVIWFLFIETRRYRYYELWSYRVRLMETDFYAAMLVPPFIFWIFRIPAWLMLVYWFGVQVFTGLPELMPVRPEVSSRRSAMPWILPSLTSSAILIARLSGFAW